MLRITYSSFNKYYSILRKRGYIDRNDTKVMLILSFINKLSSGDFLQFVTDSDYKYLWQAINCLSLKDCCLVEIPFDFKVGFCHKPKPSVTYKVTEDNRLRITEDSLLRSL